MIDRSIRERKNKYCRCSTSLQSIALDKKNDKKSFEIKKKQDEMYKIWKFYDNYIKAVEKIKK